MSSHIIDSLELFFFIKLYLWSCVTVELVVILKQLVAEIIFHDIWVDYIQVHSLRTILGFMPFFALDEFDWFDRKGKEHFLLKQITLIANLNVF